MCDDRSRRITLGSTLVRERSVRKKISTFYDKVPITGIGILLVSDRNITKNNTDRFPNVF